VALGHQIAFVGVANERSYVESLHTRLTPEEQLHVANTAGLLSLGELLALIEGAACVLTNDTGPMHMAIALQRPTVCLFGPANPEHYGQQFDNVRIFYARVFCSPCLYEADQPPCNGNNICMQRIRPQPVIQSVLRLTKEHSESTRDEPRVGPTRKTRNARRRRTRAPIISDAPDETPLGLVVRASLSGASVGRSSTQRSPKPESGGPKQPPCKTSDAEDLIAPLAAIWPQLGCEGISAKGDLGLTNGVSRKR